LTTSFPQLIVIAGPARGRSLSVEGNVSIGRDELNALPILDPALSRHHCVIERDASGLVLKDLASKNGVFVNELPITERVLADGDQIRIGDSALVVVIPGPTAPTPNAVDRVALDDTPVPASSTVSIDAVGSRYLNSDQIARRGETRAAADLKVLVRFSQALQGATTADSLYGLLLSHALEAAPADGGVILAVPSGDDALSVAAVKSSGRPVTINRAIAARAIAERVAVSVSGVPAPCVPLLGREDVPSVLCLTRSTGAAPFSDDDLQLLAAIGSIGGLAFARVRHVEWLNAENERLRQDAAIEHNLVGESGAMQRVFQFIARVAPTDATVLLRGESGTGKELIAHALHANSPRARGPFVAINCAALPDALLESELFGHERGAFTGAVSQQRGRLEMADRGTLFLDEIGELAPPLQAKLLRVLQDQIVERVGARRGIKIDVRVIAATNRDLEQAMAAGAFRKDLYYRLNVVALAVPPLRERREDLPLLASYFLRKHAAGCKRAVRGIRADARTLLAGYDWPGNVRELSNAIERAVVLGSSDVILPEDLPEAMLESAFIGPSDQSFHARMTATKRAVILDALEQNGGNVAGAARLLDLQVTYLHRLIKNLGLRFETRHG